MKYRFYFYFFQKSVFTTIYFSVLLFILAVISMVNVEQIGVQKHIMFNGEFIKKLC